MELKNKRVLITGADGFIGSHLVEALLSQGANIRALSQYNSFNHWGWLDTIPEVDKIHVVTGDIRDMCTCDLITKNIDIIFHLAALIAIPYSYQAPEAYIETNIKGTANLCQAAITNKCEHFLHTSTSEVYGSALYTPIDEKHPLQPQSPYSASKIGADSIAQSYFYSYNLPLTIVRPFNTYGPRQSARAIIPTIITQIATGKKAISLGDVTPTRDFTYVLDTCDSFLALATTPQSIGEVVNVGTNTEITIEDLFKMIASLMNSPAILIHDEKRNRPKKSEVRQLRCNQDKLTFLTQYSPKTPIEKGLLTTIQWFMDPKNINKYKAELYNV